MFTDSKGITKELEKHPTAPALHWVVVETEIRAWVENPKFSIVENEPAFILCEITDQYPETRHAEVRPIDSPIVFLTEYSKVKCVHLYAPKYQTITKFLGDVK